MGRYHGMLNRGPKDGTRAGWVRWRAHSSLLFFFSLLQTNAQMQLVTVDDVLTMMGDTSSLGEKGEVEKLVAAVARLFSPGDDDYPYLPYPTGYSGEVNKVG